MSAGLPVKNKERPAKRDHEAERSIKVSRLEELSGVGAGGLDREGWGRGGCSRSRMMNALAGLSRPGSSVERFVSTRCVLPHAVVVVLTGCQNSPQDAAVVVVLTLGTGSSVTGYRCSTSCGPCD